MTDDANEHVALLQELLSAYGDSGFSEERAALRAAIAALQQRVTLREVTDADGDKLRSALYKSRNAFSKNPWFDALQAILPRGIPATGSEGEGK